MAGPTGPRQTLDKFAAGVLAGSQSAKVLMVDGTNPVFAAPKAWKVKDALDKAGFIVSFANFVDETSVLADLILPDHSFLESWAEALPESGSIDRRRQRRRTGDEAAVPDARDGRCPARRRAAS